MNYIFEPDGGRLDNVIRFKNSPLNSIRVTTKYKVGFEGYKRVAAVVFCGARRFDHMPPPPL